MDCRNHNRIKPSRMYKGKIKVMLAGTFDIVHKGHIDMFRQAKELGDYLIVIVARDQNVRKLKGASPFHDENKRKAELEKIDIIDEIRLGSLGDPYKVIEEIRPDVICIVYDQGFFAEKLEDELEKRRMNAKIIRLKAHKPHKYKSSKIRKSILV